jgi:Protein of unknown function (DUF3365)
MGQCWSISIIESLISINAAGQQIADGPQTWQIGATPFSRKLPIMKVLRFFILLAPALLLQTALADETKARATAAELVQALGAALKKEMADGGPAAAIGVCRDLAPKLAGELSRKTGGKVSRVSLRLRNPLLGQPDAWEQEMLISFDKRSAAGETADKLDVSENVTEPAGRYFRYMKALPVQPLCLACHGEAASIAESVKSRLAQDYPHDRATGYAPGQIRGAVSIKWPAD